MLTTVGSMNQEISVACSGREVNDDDVARTKQHHATLLQRRTNYVRNEQQEANTSRTRDNTMEGAINMSTSFSAHISQTCDDAGPEEEAG
jgi:hypothetical protein